MPKMRGIKPETWTDDKLVEVSPLARLLFIGMWNYACDNGHVENKPRQLKMRILPGDDCEVSDLIAELVSVGCVHDRGTFLDIPTLPSHQRIDRRYFTSCDHCPPADRPQGARSAHDGDTTGARSAHALKEGRKEEKEGDGESSATGTPRDKPAAKRATQLPADFRPTEKHVALADELGVDLRAEWPKFCDHHSAKGTTFKDWNAALRTWIRNAPAFRGNVRALPAPQGGTDWMRRR